MKNTKKIIIGLVTLIILLAVFYGGYFKNNKEIEFFNEKFGIQLPKESETIFSNTSYGALGDGYRLYIYQVTSESMKAIAEKGRANYWSELPIPSDFTTSFSKKIRAITDETTSKLIPLDAARGYYMIRNNQTNASITGTNVFDSSFDNVMIGIMDLDNNRIYLLSYNM
ncbi:hypothetical protein [Paenibacillus sp. HW567]|uniref:hypothetical protein n=1 Tax=Paenibacillus sp. HW567 TaxID=1034769 RepID=UPI00038070BF|nr:hypothetical protein [Paenibacillus sp. HW567]